MLADEYRFGGNISSCQAHCLVTAAEVLVHSFSNLTSQTSSSFRTSQSRPSVRPSKRTSTWKTHDYGCVFRKLPAKSNRSKSAKFTVSLPIFPILIFCIDFYVYILSCFSSIILFPNTQLGRLRIRENTRSTLLRFD